MSKTFRQLEAKYGYENDEPHGDSPLELWYERVRDTPLTAFPPGGLARACRQKLFSTEVAAIALDMLEEDVCAGDLYEGELLSAMIGLGWEFWRSHEALDRLVPILEDAVRAEEMMSEVTVEAADFLRQLRDGLS